jgi:hypothetical protein
LQVDLRDSSGTLIQSFATGSLSDAWVTQSFTVTNSISSYTGLRLEIIDVRDGGGAGRGLDVSWVEFEIPDAAPTFDITGGTTTPMQTTSGTMTFVASAPTFDITGAVTTPIQVGSGTIDFVKPIYEIDGAVTIPIQIISGAADFVKPIYTIDGAVTIPIQVGSGTATFGSPSFDINGAVNIPMQTVSGTADFVKPIYSITGGVTTPIATVSGTATTGAVTGLQAAYWDGTQYRQGTLKVYHNSEWKNINLQRYKNGQWH